MTTKTCDFVGTGMQDASTWSQLLHIMSDLYSTSVEHIFLGYLSQLLLEATADTPDYKQNIFKAPLSKCEFEDFKMILSWRYNTLLLYLCLLTHWRVRYPSSSSWVLPLLSCTRLVMY